MVLAAQIEARSGTPQNRVLRSDARTGSQLVATIRRIPGRAHARCSASSDRPPGDLQPGVQATIVPRAATLRPVRQFPVPAPYSRLNPARGVSRSRSRYALVDLLDLAPAECGPPPAGTTAP